MKTINYSGPKTFPDFVKERDVFGQIKSNRTSIVNRFKNKHLIAPDLKVVYAGLGIRTLATFIDLIIIACLMLIPEVLFLSFNFKNIDFNSYRFLMVMAIWIFYHTGLDSSALQGTIGKRLLKLKIVDLYGKNISIVRAFFRCMSVFISIAPVGLGIWYISTDRKKRSWHDLIAGSYVIKS